MLKPANLTWSDDGRLYNADYDDIYFQPAEGILESKYVFLEQNNLETRFQNCDKKNAFTIAETGFGSGLNFLLTCGLWQEFSSGNGWLHFISFEKHPILKSDLAKIFQNWPDLKHYSDPLLDKYPEPIAGLYKIDFSEYRISLYLAFGDISETLPQIDATVDAWFLDGFAPQKNPDMWQDNLFQEIKRLTAHQGSFATFTAAGFIRRALQNIGFDVKKVKGYGRKREMLVGQMSDISSQQEIVNEPWFHIEKPAYKKHEAIVIGAGIAGCSAAHALLKRGWSVTVIDQHNAPATATSGNAVGISYPRLTAEKSPMGDFNLMAFCYTKQLAETLPKTQFTASGVLHLNINSSLDKKHQKIPKLYSEYQEYVQHVTSDEASEVAGVDISYPALFYPSAGYLKPPHFCADLLEQYPENCKTLFNTTITSIEKSGSKWCVFNNKHNMVKSAEILIIANNQAFEKCLYTDWLPLEFTKGQTSYIHSSTESENIKSVICHKGYITPSSDQKHVIGATFERTNVINYDVTDQDHQKNIQELTTYLPDLNMNTHAIYGGRVGYRTATPDKLPLIGPCPDLNWFHKHYANIKHGRPYQGYSKAHYHDGLYLSLGYSSHGMTSAPLAGEIIASLITKDPLPIPRNLLNEILPQRFIIRDLKRS